MRAITLTPGLKGSARLEEVPEPAGEDGALLVRAQWLATTVSRRPAGSA